MLWLRAFIFTILVPGSVAGLIPFLLIRNRTPDLGWGDWQLIGFPVILFGIMIYVATVLSFLIKGKGTPAIWFTKPLSWLIGKEPVNMVSTGLYKYSRNPMYLGVMITVLGEGIFLGYSILLLYCLVLFFIFHFIVVLIEEPHLSRKFGKEYEDYKKRTRRWF